jgi:hypothetical protein
MATDPSTDPAADHRARLRHAAIEAELGTGSRDSSDRQMRRNILAASAMFALEI